MRQNIHSTIYNFAPFLCIFYILPAVCLLKLQYFRKGFMVRRPVPAYDGVHMCACVIISLVWAFFWSTGVLIESSGLSVAVQCCLHHSCNCHVGSLHTATVLFNWELTFSFLKDSLLPTMSPTHCHLTVLVKSGNVLLLTVKSTLMKHKKNVFVCLFPAFLYICVSVWHLVFTQDERT